MRLRLVTAFLGFDHLGRLEPILNDAVEKAKLEFLRFETQTSRHTYDFEQRLLAGARLLVELDPEAEAQLLHRLYAAQDAINRDVDSLILRELDVMERYTLLLDRAGRGPAHLAPRTSASPSTETAVFAESESD